MSKGIELINLMREYASVDYQDRIPEVTQDNIQQVGDLLLASDYQDTYNEFIGIIQKIAKTIFVSRSYENKLKRLNKGELPYGVSVEELAVEVAKGTEFDPTGTNNMARVVPHTIAYYHSASFEHTYQVSISRYQVKTAFRSADNLDRFISECVNSLYNGYEQDDYLTMKEVIGGEVLNAKPIAVAKPTDETTGKSFMKALRNTTQALTYFNTEYSPIGFPTHCPTSEQILLIDYRVISELSVEVLASAFNRADVDYTTTIIGVDDFGSFNKKLSGLAIDQSAYAILFDVNSALFYDMDLFMERDHNGKGAFDTLSLHVRKNYSFSHIRDIAVFVENTPIELASTFEGAVLVGKNTDINELTYKNLAKTSDANMSILVYNDGTLVSSGTATLTIAKTDGTSTSTTATITDGTIAVSSLSLTLSEVSSITLTNIE